VPDPGFVPIETAANQQTFSLGISFVLDGNMTFLYPGSIARPLHRLT
jgi:hypothetical protein